MRRTAAVGGGMVISAVTATVNLVYQVMLLAALGAANTLDTFYLTRTVPFFLERLSSNYFTMILLPGLVFAPVSLRTAFARVCRTRTGAAVISVYGLLVLAPLLLVRWLTDTTSLMPGSVTAGRIVVLASMLLAVNMLITAWFNSRQHYLVGLFGSLFNIGGMLFVLLLFRADLTLVKVAVTFCAGPALQLVWLSGAYFLTPAPVADTGGKPGEHGTASAVGMAALGAGSNVTDRITSAWLPEGGVSIMKVARQLIETATNVVFGTLSASSLTLQCRARRDAKSAEALAVADCSVVGLIAGLLMVGLITPFGRYAFGAVFGHGLFGMQETGQLHVAVSAMAPMLALLPVSQLLSYCYFSHSRYALPLVAAGTAAAADISLKLLLLHFGLVGIASANSLAVLIHVCVLAAFLPACHSLQVFSVLLRTALLIGAGVAAAKGLAALAMVADPFGVTSTAVGCLLFCGLAPILFPDSTAAVLRTVLVFLRRR